MRLLTTLVLLISPGALPASVPVAWDPAQRAVVQTVCKNAGLNRTFCDCFTRELEVVHPSSETEPSPDDMRAAIKVCVVPTPRDGVVTL